MRASDSERSRTEIRGATYGRAPKDLYVVERSLPVVAPTTESVSSGTKQKQNYADDEHDDTEGPQDRDMRDETDDQQDDAENDHLNASLADPPRVCGRDSDRFVPAHGAI